MLGLTGCASHVHTPFQQEQNAALGRAIPVAYGNRLAHRREPVYPAFRYEKETGQHWVHSLSLPSAGENGQEGNLVTARYYQGKSSGAKPLIIVLPVWGVSRYPSNAMADHLRRQNGGNLDILQVLGEETLFDWDAMANAQNEDDFMQILERMITRFSNTVTDVRRLVEWADRQPGVDPKRIGLVGFSMSALVGSVAIAQEPRLRAGVLAMGGADLHEAFANCGTRMRRAREGVVERFGWTLEEFKQVVKEPLAKVNPIRTAGLIDPSRILIIEADRDTCLQRPGRDSLWEAMGRPERIAYNYGHNMAFMAMTPLGGWNLQGHVQRFFKQTILPQNPQNRYEANRFLREWQTLPFN